MRTRSSLFCEIIQECNSCLVLGLIRESSVSKKMSHRDRSKERLGKGDIN